MRDFAKKLLAATAIASLLSGPALAGGVPQVPATSQYSEPSQIVSTLNALVNQLNGNGVGLGGYATQPNNTISLGQFCAVAGTATTEICNGQRGTVALTAQATIAAGGVVTETITDSVVTANSVCPASIIAQTVAASSEVTIASVTASAGSLAVVVQNPTATATGATGAWTIAINCIN
jgi:hypothetical protein